MLTHIELAELGAICLHLSVGTRDCTHFRIVNRNQRMFSWFDEKSEIRHERNIVHVVKVNLAITV